MVPRDAARCFGTAKRSESPLWVLSRPNAVAKARSASPGTVAAKAARRPGDRDALLYGLPVGVAPASGAVHQNHGVCFSAHVDAAKWLSAPSAELTKCFASIS